MKDDFSVSYSIYIGTSMEQFNTTYTMTELFYKGENPDLTGKPDKFDSFSVGNSYIEALNVPLGTYEDLENGVKQNDYVLYAAVDLMRAVYSEKWPNEKVFACFLYYSYSGIFLSILFAMIWLQERIY